MTETTTQQQSLSSKLRHHPISTLREEMDELLSRMFGMEEGWLAGRFAVLADLSETDTLIEIRLDLPGVNPDDIEIRVTGNTLTIRGERKEMETEKGRTFHRIERRSGCFSRSISLPCAVVEDEAIAEYRDGVLIITLPKCEESQSRRIEVKR